MSAIVMPDRIARLPRDRRGFPIPWNVLRADDGTPFFTVNDDRKAWTAIKESLCPICGERLGKWRWFIGGPRSAFDPAGYYLDLPTHRECAEFALAICPYLALPKYLGRIDVVNPEKLPPEAKVLLDETMITERPEIFVAVTSERVELLDREQLPPYLKPLQPFSDWTFWRHGQQIPAHRAMPVLRGIFGAEWEFPRRAE
ncbi:MAG TPA: hypothetical protein VGG62_12185 [Terracidiphilus sp.]|jgi:hypothetical protein